MFKFDDIGCMVGHVAEEKGVDSVAAFFVVDFHTKRWLKADEAGFTISPNFHTPMGGGMVAFNDKAPAEAAAAANQGRLISFAEALQWRGKVGR